METCCICLKSGINMSEITQSGGTDFVCNYCEMEYFYNYERSERVYWYFWGDTKFEFSGRKSSHKRRKPHILTDYEIEGEYSCTNHHVKNSCIMCWNLSPKLVKYMVLLLDNTAPGFSVPHSKIIDKIKVKRYSIGFIIVNPYLLNNDLTSGELNKIKHLFVKTKAFKSIKDAAQFLDTLSYQMFVKLVERSPDKNARIFTMYRALLANFCKHVFIFFYL